MTGGKFLSQNTLEIYGIKLSHTTPKETLYLNLT